MKKYPALAASLTLSILLAAGPALAELSPRAAADHIELKELTHRYALGIDTIGSGEGKQLLSTVFTDDSVARYVEVGSNVLDMDVTLEGFKEIYQWLEEGLGHRKGTDGLPWHFMTNHLIDVNGDEATMRVYMHNRTMAAGGVYYIDAVRTKDGWRVKNFRLEEQMWKPEAYKTGPEAERLKHGS